jgi:putative membrane protein
MTTQTTDRRLVTAVLIVLGALLVVPTLFVGFGGMMGGPMMGGMWGSGMGPDGTIPQWAFLVGAVMQFLMLAVLIGAGYLLYRAVTGTTGSSDRALDELRLAYARGELTDEEYETRREVLERDE